MDYLWTPWRYPYVAGAARSDGCIFCEAVESGDDRATLIVLRSPKTFVILNRYPYTSGHVMIVPYDHKATLADLPAETAGEMMLMAQRVQAAMHTVYRPDGYNLGINIGRAAGAGVAGHIHLHVLPRWSGDTNFMTTVGTTRVQPEELSATYEKLHAALKSQ